MGHDNGFDDQACADDPLGLADAEGMASNPEVETLHDGLMTIVGFFYTHHHCATS